MKKQPEVTDLTRESFVTAFFQLAEIKNINQITIREITNRAGYNRTTFYRYFEDVYALIEYAEDEFINNARNILSEHYNENSIGERRFFEVMISCFHENKARITVLMSEQNRAHFLRRIRENMPNNLYKGSDDTPKIRVVKYMYFYGIMHAVLTNLQSKDVLPDEDLLDIIQSLFSNWYLPAMTEEA
ncbi:MAG: TetR/AcrR family transcriptional regulator [Oscillospiraceae bacterium]|nr:TetR/AcrR family transcriptional regulator [Oscillospiraceae bacterium]